MSTFAPDLHPRGNAHNAGQFRQKSNTAPGGALLDLRDRISVAENVANKVAVSKIRETAPAGAAAVVYELYNEGDSDAELFAFQHALDKDGEPIEIDRDRHEELFALGQHFDRRAAQAAGFDSDGVVFTVDVPHRGNIEASGQAVEDAVQLYQYAKERGDIGAATTADRQLHAATATHIRALASHMSRPAASVTLDWGEDGLWVTGVEDADGVRIYDERAHNHPMFGSDADTVLEMGFAASNIRQPELAGLTDLSGTDDGPYRLILNP